MTHLGRFIVRPHLWLASAEPWECPGGHRLATNAAVIEHDALICQQKMERGSVANGFLVYPIAVQSLTPPRTTP